MKKHTLNKTYLLLTTKNGYVLSSRSNVNVDALQPCTHTEADTLIFLHLKDATENGHKIIKVRTVDPGDISISPDPGVRAVVGGIWKWKEIHGYMHTQYL